MSVSSACSLFPISLVSICSKPPSPWATALQFTPDTLIGTLITVAAVLGAGLPISVALVVAVVHLFADGMSICLAEYLEASAHADHVGTERTTTLEQVEINRDAYVADMIQSYVDKGLTRIDAELVVRTLAKYDGAFTDAVLLGEEAVTPAELATTQGLTPLHSGLIIYACFVAVGSLPLLPFLLGWVAEDVSPSIQCLASILVSLVLNFFIGVEKGVAEGQPRGNWWTSGFSLTANAMLSGALAFLLGFALQPLVQQVYLQAPAIPSSLADSS